MIRTLTGKLQLALFFSLIASTGRVDAQAAPPATENAAPNATPPKQPGEVGAADETPFGGSNPPPTPSSLPSSPAAPVAQAPAVPPAPTRDAPNGAPRPSSAPGDALLAPVVVTAPPLDEALPAQLSSYGTRVDRVSVEQIQHGGYTDVAQSLETLVPGLYMSPKNGPFDYVTVSLQGSRTQDVLWLLDGVRLNNRLYGGTTPLDTFPASIVERLEVLEGPQALFYGTQGVAGAVIIVTKPFSDQLGGSLALGADTTGGRHLDAFVRDGFHRHQFVIYGSSDRSDGFQPFRDQDYQASSTDRHRSYDVLTLGAKYSYRISEDLRLSALYQHTDGRLDFALPFLAATAFNRRQEDVLSAKLDYSPSGPVQLYGKAYYHSWRSHYTEFDNVVGTPGTLDNVDDDDFWGYKDYGVNALGRVAFGPWLASNIGYDFQSYSGNDAVLVITEKTEHVHAVFAQLRTSERLHQAKLAVGFRYNVPSVGPSAAIWNASGQYDLVGDALFVRGTVGTAFRLPTAEELFANDPMDERGDPNLKPERSLNVNVSVGGNVRIAGAPRLNWEAIAFGRNVTDLISGSGFDDATNQSLFENVSGTVRVRGGTAVVEARPLDALSASVSYTYTSARQTGKQQIDGVPTQLSKAWIDYHPLELPFGLNASANHVGAVYKSFGAGDREKFGNYTIFDVAGRVFLDPARHHTIDLRLANVFGTQYAAGLAKGTSDADGSSYTYWNLGLPRTLEGRYRYTF